MYFLIDGDTFLPAPQEAAGNTYLLPKTTLKTLVVFSEGAWLASNLGAAAFLLGDLEGKLWTHISPQPPFS